MTRQKHDGNFFKTCMKYVDAGWAVIFNENTKQGVFEIQMEKTVRGRKVRGLGIVEIAEVTEKACHADCALAAAVEHIASEIEKKVIESRILDETGDSAVLKDLGIKST